MLQAFANFCKQHYPHMEITLTNIQYMLVKHTPTHTHTTLVLTDLGDSRPLTLYDCFPVSFV